MFFKVTSFLNYYWTAETDHYLHSPLVFEIYKLWKENNQRFTENILKQVQNGHDSVVEIQKIDHIRNTKDKFSNWQELIKDIQYNYTIDFGNFGLLIETNNGSPKQHFVLR